MAVVSLQELIAQRETIEGKKKQVYELDTEVGTLVAKQPTAAIIAEMQNMRNPLDSNAYIVYNCVIEPDLTSSELQKAFKVFDPMDIVKAIFKPGEIVRIGDALLELAGYGGKIETRVHNAVKN